MRSNDGSNKSSPSSVVSVQRKRKSSSSSSSISTMMMYSWAVLVLVVFYDCETEFGGDRFRRRRSSSKSGGATTTAATFWVESFSPVVTVVAPTTTSSSPKRSVSPYSRRIMLQADGVDENSGDDEMPSAAATAVVLSVFSKPPGRVFRELSEATAAAATNDGTAVVFLGLDDLRRWDELKEIVDDGDLTVTELRDLYDAAVAEGNDGLDLEGFKAFYRSVDDLFDEDDDDNEEAEEDSNGDDVPEGTEPATGNTEIAGDGGESDENTSRKEDLVSYLEEVQSRPCDSEDGTLSAGERRPWGLDWTDRERENIAALLVGLATDVESSNVIGSNNSDSRRPMSEKDLTKHILGTWDLRYTSSRTMIINKSLSGLGRSTSEMARNLGLTMTLSGSYYYGKTEFVETFGGNDGDAMRLEATVTGEWILETGSRLDYKTGLPSVSLRVEVETIAYGPNKSAAEQWDSLSPIKLVDVLYLDDDLMILRGNANVDALFIYTRRR